VTRGKRDRTESRSTSPFSNHSPSIIVVQFSILHPSKGFERFYVLQREQQRGEFIRFETVSPVKRSGLESRVQINDKQSCLLLLLIGETESFIEFQWFVLDGVEDVLGSYEVSLTL
jgi:hypothetical protein